jgi:hypothetical protein
VRLVQLTDPAAGVIVPDLHVRESNLPGFGTPVRAGEAAAPSVASAVISPAVEIEFELEWSLSVRESLIEIRDLAGNRVVTIVEVLSPANKVPASAGFVSYNDKRERALSAGCNVVEIDLLRAGDAPYRRPPIDGDYVVVVSRPRPNRTPRRQAWPFTLRDRLPTVPVPLKPEDGHAVLDLHSVLQIAYDRAAYDIRINYAAECRPRLTAMQDEWSHALLTGKGLRDAGRV